MKGSLALVFCLGGTLATWFIDVVVSTSQLPLQLHWLNDTDAESACMDGSPYGYYFRPSATRSTAYKWVLELQGGGWCYNEGACYGRTLPSYGNGVFGSSVNWTTTMTGYFQENQDWNRVFLRYCSGASFTSYRSKPWDASGWPVPGYPGMVVPNGTKLWFRGASNIAETIRALQKVGAMAKVEELIVTGSSAGGLATILNIDRIAKLTQAQRAVGLADAGFFKYQGNQTASNIGISSNFSANMRHCFEMANSSGVLNPKCLEAQITGQQNGTAVPAPQGSQHPLPGPWNCFMAATAIEYTESPVFVLQSSFDHFQLGHIASIPCIAAEPYQPPWTNSTCGTDDVHAISLYGTDLRAELSRVATAPTSKRGLYLSACVVHGQVQPQAWEHTVINGITPQQAWRQWYNGSSRDGHWIEDCDLPCNNNTVVCAPF